MAAVTPRPWDGQKARESSNTLEVDVLLEKYLGILDEYQNARKELNKGLGTGFLSLAHANFTSPNRIHYGQDHYDDRMQASRRITISEHGESLEVSMRVLLSGIETTGKEKGKDIESSKLLYKDPASWYGAFISPALRDSQSKFVSAMDSAIRIVVLENKLKNIENQIQKLKTTV